ncbi:hypothetical protein FKM82_011318, partial [Ascaphus truei]
VNRSPGSVVARYAVALAESVSTETLVANDLSAAQLIPDVVSSQLSTSGVASIQPRNLKVKFWCTIQLTCQVNESMAAAKWSLFTNNNTNMIFKGGGNVDISTQFLPNSTLSTLTINTADQFWFGIFICQFMKGTLVHEARANVTVTLLPTEIIVDPLQKSVSVEDPSQLVLQCCVKHDGEVYNVSWTYNNITQYVQPVEKTGLQCYTLAAPHPATDTNYTCTFTNTAGQRKKDAIPVTVIQAEDKFCSINMSNEVTWNLTKGGIKVTSNCPGGKWGNLTRDCSADGVWMDVQDNCISKLLKTALDNAQTLEQGLGDSQANVPQIIQQLATNDGTTMTNIAEMMTMVNILETIAKVSVNQNNTFDTNVITNFLMVASDLTDPIYSSLWKRDNGLAASQVLQSVEQFSLLLKTENETFVIALENIQLKGTSYGKGSRGDKYLKSFDLNLGVSMSIGKHTITALTEQNHVTITTMVFNTIGNLLPRNTRSFNNSQLNSIVQSTTIRLSDYGYFTGDIFMTFGINVSDNKYTQHCVFWDFTLPGPGGGWSDFGCTSKVERDTTYCTCNHLTSFAVLMSVNVESLFLIEEITYTGLGVSILSLCICVFIEFLVWKSVVRTNISYFRHTSLVNIALSLLFADICFLSSAFPSVKTHKYICLSITFFNHFFYLSLFFWTFCQSVMLLHQLLFVFHHLRKRVYVSLSFFVGYFFPAAIAAGTFLYFYPKERYSHQTVCWLNPESGAIFAFAIPAGSIIVFNLITLLVVISKLLRPSVSEANHPDDRETAKSIMKAILVLTPVFGLTWAFGFALLKDLDDLTRQIFAYGFAGMNAFQGLFILLTTCFTEKKVSTEWCSDKYKLNNWDQKSACVCYIDCNV